MRARKIFWTIALLVAFLLGYRMYTRVFMSKAQDSQRAIPVIVQNPTIGPIEENIILAADIKAQTEVTVRPRMAGRVQEIYVEEGLYVEKGDPLLSYVEGISPDDDLYNDMVVFSPISGVVGMKLVKVGEHVTSQVGGLVNPVFVIYDIESVKAYANVPEKYYSFIRKGMPARISLDAYPGEVFAGSVNNVRPVIDPLSRTTQIEIVLLNGSKRIKPGMFGKIDLALKKVSAALIIPFDAVMGDGEKTVFVSEGGKAKKRPVTLGLQQENSVQVVKGLVQSDKVIVSGQRVVNDGGLIKEQGK
jgi:membrane fusion protein, multidrug efflux system